MGLPASAGLKEAKKFSRIASAPDSDLAFNSVLRRNRNGVPKKYENDRKVIEITIKLSCNLSRRLMNIIL